MLTTTRGRLRACDACEDRYAFLCTWAPEGDEAPIPLEDILKHNGTEDALWAIRAVDDNGGLGCWMARWCAAQVAHLWEPPAVVRHWLRTGAEPIRFTPADAAWAAATATSAAAARSAATARSAAATRAAIAARGAALAAAAARSAATARAADAARSAVAARGAALVAAAARAAATGTSADAAWAAVPPGVAAKAAIGRKLAWAIQELRAGRPLPQIRIPTSAKTAWRGHDNYEEML